MPYRAKWFLLCLILMLGLPGPWALAVPRLKIDPPVKKIPLDQLAILKIRLEWPQDEGPYEINSREPTLENLTLEKQNQSQETGAAVRHTLTYEFRPVKKGAAVIDPFEVSYRKSETEPWIPLMIPEQNMTVVSSWPLRSILIGLLIAAGFLALILTGFKVRTTLAARNAARNRPPPDPKQRIYAKAEESIATFVSPDPKEKLIHWSNLLRTVVVTYYDISDGKTTLAEVLSRLRSKGLLAGEWNEVSRLFEQLSEMQFSRQDIPAHALEQLQKTLLQYVRGKIIIGNSNA